MASRPLTERVADLRSFRAVKAAGIKFPLWPQNLAHVYVKLDFRSEFENAGTADDAKGFLRSVARGAMAANHIGEHYNGFLLEVQGSTLHMGLQEPYGATLMDSANAFVTDLHWAYRILFADQKKRVQGWLMTVDIGNTLIVAGRGAHGDDSFVSLGTSANRPAKHLYAQLELPEEDRALKQFHVGIRRASSLSRNEWDHYDLNRSKSRLPALSKIAEDARHAEPKLDFVEPTSGRKQVTARAVPLDPAGAPGSPLPDKPHTYFGWVMRADLDGFTARVQDCLDKDEKLQELAEEFYRIMDVAVEFTERHKENLAQLPWAGDNFTAAAVFTTKDEYDNAIPKRLVELTLDFEKDMAAAAVDCGYGGWAHGVAGGEVHGNCAGNVYLAGVEVGGRRFLVGVGEGFGRSTQAFGDINPKAKQIVVYNSDWKRLDESSKRAFEPALTHRTQKQSTLFRTAHTDVLRKVQARAAAATSFTPIFFPGEQPRSVPARPHYR